MSTTPGALALIAAKGTPGICLRACGMLLLIFVGFVPFPARAGEPVDVQLRDGRVVRGMIDAATDRDWLWLSQSTPSVELKSAFRWDHVVTARRAQEILPVDALRRLADSTKTAPGTFDRSEGFHSQAAAVWATRINQRLAIRPPAPSGHQPWTTLPPPNGQVRSLHISACPANWDDDLEADGLRVLVCPVDEFGISVPVDGTIEFRLVGRQLSPTDRTRLFPELGRWTESLCAGEFGPRGIVVELPFQRFHPETDLDVGTESLLTARLAVPGEGVFDASTADVVLRPFSRMRDELQLFEDNRFAPAERPRRRTRYRGSRFVRPILRG